MTRVFRALLALYPAAFRDEYGRELVLVFRDRYRRAATSWARALVWLDALSGVVQEAPRERVGVMREDLRFAWRSIRQHALVSLAIVITLGLGIGANTAVFSVLNAIALRSPLRVDAPDRLYAVTAGPRISTGLEATRISGPTFDALRRAAPPGVGVAAMSRGIARVYTRTGGERDTTRASLQLVSPNFFGVLGIAPARGRTFRSVDGDPMPELPEVILSHGYWQSRFGGADAIGRTLVINGSAYTVVGVGPRDFTGVWLENPVDAWVPLSMQPALKYSQSFTADGARLNEPWLPQTGVWWLHVVTRVPPGRESAVKEALTAALAGTVDAGTPLAIDPFARGFSRFRQQFSTPLVALLIMAGLVLCIACANVANLLLARAVGRRREIAVRMAIGAGRARLLQLLLTESAILVGCAGIAALLFAQWAGAGLIGLAMATLDAPVPIAVTLDGRVLAFTAGTAFLCVAAFAAWPAWRATRLDVATALTSSPRGAVGDRSASARVLVILQVALSLVLVTGTSLFVRSFRQLTHAGLGFEPVRLLSVIVEPRLAEANGGSAPMAYSRVLDAVTAVAGVESAAMATCSLQASCAREDGFGVEGRVPRPGESLTFAINAVTSGYVETVGMRLAAGRPLQASDADRSPKVAVINRTLAQAYFGGAEQAVGRRVGQGALDTEIVGVVDDARALDDLKAAATPTLFVPLPMRGSARVLEVRTLGDPTSVAAAVRRAIADAVPGLPIERLEPMSERVHRGLGQERVVALVTAGFSLLAVSLAGFGLFSIVSYAVARRTPEIGLRVALGATRADVVSRVVGEGLWLVGVGVLLGLPLALLAGRLLSTVVFGIGPYDAASLAVAIGLLLVVGAGCGLVPARRAIRVDPIAVLRQE